MAYDDLVARFTLAGSLTSCIATLLVLLSYFTFQDQQYSFRHALILNLAAAEFINTLNNSISGFIYVSTKKLNAGPACTANGFVGQLTVQAVDFTIFAIVLVTLLTITRKTYLPDVSIWAKTLICASTWIVPIITSVVAVSLNAITPVSGNWCWITPKRADLRYSLTHGWRIGIIFLTVVLYAYIWWFVHCHFKALFGSRGDARLGYNPFTGAVHTESALLTKERLEESQGTTLIGEADTRPLSDIGDTPKALRDSRDDDMSMSEFSLPIQGAEDVVGAWEQDFVSNLTPPAPTVGHGEGLRNYSRLLAAAEGDKPANCPRVRHSVDVRVSIAKGSYSWLPPGIPPGDPPGSSSLITPHTETKISSTHCSRTAPPQHQGHASVSAHDAGHPSRAQKVEKEIRRMLLLASNAYPTLYVLLWIPGIVNRLMEATGQTPSNPRAVAALQSTSQFVGFANALTFGLNATMRRRLGSAAARAKRKFNAGTEAWRNV
ncbi:hypothetical protein DHEL01_v207291 [Diaporthe helianthi]|uniref:Glucose receptor Git3-like N-terminal domain-containing protein n=1 Tax=Diaporthe helianthi TaxID=158607 RepID=A0A2P5HVR6_DIAHE|nr:hypothetical protein DHEL01_v207291 [Diaporthe helianthi]